MLAELISRDQRIEDLNQQLIETNQVVTDLSILNRQNSNSLGSIHATALSQSAAKETSYRSAKVDDPDQFYNEPEKEKLEIDAWRLDVEARLQDNADWFLSDDQQINYIMRRLAGKASRETTPFP